MLSKVLERYGKVDILVNNAGATWGAPAEDHPLEAWQKLVNLNLTGTFLVTQAVGKRSMIPNRYGRIVNVASIAGCAQPGGHAEDARVQHDERRGGEFHAHARGGVGRVRHHGDAIAPGFFPSKMTKTALERLGEKIIAHTPLQRLGDGEDLKGVVALLAFGRVAPHLRTDHRRRRRRKCGVTIYDFAVRQAHRDGTTVRPEPVEGRREASPEGYR